MIQQSLPFPVDIEISSPLSSSIEYPKEMPWVNVTPGIPYFQTEDGRDWTPIGQNDAITWPELKGIFRRKDMGPAEAYLEMLSRHGVTCLRLMLEYCHGEHRYFEKPAGNFNPNMIRMWDDIFRLCEKYRIRVLLTPYDTFWMWLRWQYHPYKKSNDGPCDKRSQWLLCANTRNAIKQRLAFATERWGGSGALFAWDLWNEIHPAHADNNATCFAEFVHDISTSLRETELRVHGRSHPQTVSVFGPVLRDNALVQDCVFRHPDLDFASVHFYETNTIDHPKNTIDAAISTGRLTREALENIKDGRPFFDSEHGPIHSFKDKKKTLSEPFDDEYFLHIQWAHFASGGAGGGMRWPNRHPHSLTAGMRKAQQALAKFLPLIEWNKFNRRNLNEAIILSPTSNNFVVFGCGDDAQAVVWLLRVNSVTRNGMVDRSSVGVPVHVEVPGLRHGVYRVTLWDTMTGMPVKTLHLDNAGNRLTVPLPPVTTNLALAIRRSGDHL